MAKVKVEFRRTKTIVLTGSVEVEMSEENISLLKQGKNADAWAQFTAVGMVENWQQEPPTRLQDDITHTVIFPGGA